MGAFNMNDAEHYGGQGGHGFFKLAKNKETAQVRILYNTVDDVQGYAVHRVDLPDAKYGRDVNCLRSYKDPVDICPFCKAGIPQQAKLYIPIYNLDKGEFQFWSRGKKFFQKISSILSRYPNLVSYVSEIERNGDEGDTQTTYEIYPLGEPDDTKLEDFDIPDPLGTVLMDKTAEDMEYYLQEKDFPPDEDDDYEEERPRRREPVRGRDTGRDREPARRTPARSRRSSSNEF